MRNLLLGIVLSLAPSLQLFTDFYYVFASFGALIIFFLALLVSNLSRSSKLIIATLVSAAYKNNISLNARLLYSASLCTSAPELRRDDEELRQLVKNTFEKSFNLITNFDALPSKPSIIVCNYCTDRIENMACILLPRNMAIMMRDGLQRTLRLHRLVKWPLFTKENGNYEHSKTEIKRHIDSDRSVFAYVTKHPKLRPNYISKVRSGLFTIAKELNVPVTLLAIDYVDIKFGTIPFQNFQLHVGETFFVTDINTDMHRAKIFFRNTMTRFISEKHNNNLR